MPRDAGVDAVRELESCGKIAAAIAPEISSSTENRSFTCRSTTSDQSVASSAMFTRRPVTRNLAPSRCTVPSNIIETLRILPSSAGEDARVRAAVAAVCDATRTPGSLLSAAAISAVMPSAR